MVDDGAGILSSKSFAIRSKTRATVASRPTPFNAALS
jgi:hypothetical protein